MHSKDLSGQWGETRNIPPPQGPLPDPKSAFHGQEIRLSNISLDPHVNYDRDRALEGAGCRTNVKGTLESSSPAGPCSYADL
jgi:hypothetical protein